MHSLRSRCPRNEHLILAVLSELRAGVIGDGFGDIQRGRVATHIIGAHFAFRDYASFDSAEYERQLKEAF